MATFACQSTVQIGSWILCKDLNVTVVCNKAGNWEPITPTDDECIDQSGCGVCKLNQAL